MSNTRYMEPVIQLLFDIVKQDAPQDEEQSKQMAEEAKEYIALIQELEKSEQLYQARRAIYQKLSKKITLNKTVSLETKDEHGATVLITACKNGHTSIVQSLLQAHADPNTTDEGDRTPLHWAAFRGHVSIVQALLAAKGDLNNVGKNGVTPLMFAIHYGHMDSVEVLLHAGAATDLLNIQGDTALDYAMNKKMLPAVSLLLKHQAFINNPTELFEFLMSCDPRAPDVLFCLNVLSQQQNNLRALNLPDAKLLTNKQFQELEKYCNALSKVGDKLSHDALNATVGNILPSPLVNIVSEYNAPLYHLNSSPALFSNKKQVEQFRKQLTKQYNESFPSRKKFFGWF